MNILNKNSLSETLDNLNQVFFDDIKLSISERTKIAKWIASRQGLAGSYWNMFAPTPSDLKGIKLFTSENVTTRAGISHILGEEACHVLFKLNVKSTFPEIQNAEDGLKKAIKNAIEKGYESYGWYCCGKCSAAYWRNLSAEGVDRNKKILKAGIKILNSLRDGNGKWKRFPFYYSLYSLSDIELPEAKEELRYTANVCERLQRTMRKDGKYAERRFKLVERVLSIV